MQSVPSKVSEAPLSGSAVRAKARGHELSSSERIREAIARSEQDAKLVDFYLHWWPFDLLRSLGHWLQCWGCAFAVRLGSDPIPNTQARDGR